MPTNSYVIKCFVSAISCPKNSVKGAKGYMFPLSSKVEVDNYLTLVLVGET